MWTSSWLYYSPPTTNHYSKNEITFSAAPPTVFVIFVTQQSWVDSTKESMNDLRKGKRVKEMGKAGNRHPLEAANKHIPWSQGACSLVEMRVINDYTNISSQTVASATKKRNEEGAIMTDNWRTPPYEQRRLRWKGGQDKPGERGLYVGDRGEDWLEHPRWGTGCGTNGIMTLKGAGRGPVWLKLRDEEGRCKLWGQRGQRGQDKYGPLSWEKT